MTCVIVSPTCQSIHVTDGMTYFFAIFLQKMSAATDHVCQIALNQKLLLTFEKYCVLVMLKQNHGKRNCIK
jgi:hypothetical protein